MAQIYVFRQATLQDLKTLYTVGYSRAVLHNLSSSGYPLSLTIIYVESFNQYKIG